MSSVVGSIRDYPDDAHLSPENVSSGNDLSSAPTFKYDRPLKMEEDMKPGKADFFYGDAH